MSTIPRTAPPQYTAHDARDIFTQIDWIARATAWLALEALAADQFQGRMLDMTDQFANDLAANTAATNAATAAGAAEMQQLADAVQKLADVTAQLTLAHPPTPEQLQTIEANTAALRSIADRLTSDDTPAPAGTDGSGTGTPPPPPAPIGTAEAQAQASPATQPADNTLTSDLPNTGANQAQLHVPSAPAPDANPPTA